MTVKACDHCGNQGLIVAGYTVHDYVRLLESMDLCAECRVIFLLYLKDFKKLKELTGVIK